MDFDDARHEDLGILLSMVHVAWADGKLTRDELNLITEEAADQGLDEVELRDLREALIEPLPPEAIARYLTTENSRMAALTAAYTVALADRSLAIDEIEAVNELAVALGLDMTAVERVRDFVMGLHRKVQHGEWRRAMFLEEFMDL